MRARPYRGDIADMTEPGNAWLGVPASRLALRDRSRIGRIRCASDEQCDMDASFAQQPVRSHQYTDALVIEQAADKSDRNRRFRLPHRRERGNVDTRPRNQLDPL